MMHLSGSKANVSLSGGQGYRQGRSSRPPGSRAEPPENKEVGCNTQWPQGEIGLSEQDVRILRIRLDDVVANDSRRWGAGVSRAGAVIQKDRLRVAIIAGSPIHLRYPIKRVALGAIQCGEGEPGLV